MYYTEYPECGAALDPGERCDCRESEVRKMSSERGMNIQDAVDDMKRVKHYRKNEEFRNMKFHQQKKKKEADTAATVTTSNNVKKTLIYYTNKQEECQDVKFDPPDNS
ncbi:MAG: hypothetical protein IJ285_00965 [Clostridia bacterium]|nr:hypothetical protein [Clostridia bacterium]